MGIKKFIKDVQDMFNLELSKKESKKKNLKELVKKLEVKKFKLEKKINSKKYKNVRDILKEDHEIIILQIKKATKILKKID